MRFFDIGINRWYVVGFWLLKVLAGICLVCIYTYYYKDPGRADIHRYFNDSAIIYQVLFKDSVAFLKIMSGVKMYDSDSFLYLVYTKNFTHSSNDWITSNGFIIRVNVLMNLFSRCNIWINTLFFSFLSFTGLCAAYKFFFKHGVRNIYLIVPLFLFPSLAFWSSGILKESLLIFFIGWWLYFLKIDEGKRNNLFNIFFTGLVLMIITLVKPVTSISIVFALIVWLSFKTAKHHLVYVLVTWFIASATLVSLLGKDVLNYIITKYNEFYNLAISERATSLISGSHMFDSGKDFFASLPAATFNVLFRPFAWDSGILYTIFGLENTLFWGVLFYLFYVNLNRKYTTNVWVWALLAFAAIQYLSIAATVPVLGAVVHYRVLGAVSLFLAIANMLPPAKKV